MRFATLLALAFSLAAPAAFAQGTPFTFNGTTVGAPTADLPAFGSTEGACSLTGVPEPYDSSLFFVATDATYSITVTEPISAFPGSDDTIILVYAPSFDPAAGCANFVAIGNAVPGAPLNLALATGTQYELVVGGFFGSEDAFAVTTVGPDGTVVNSGVLPVELVSFDAVRDGDAAVLRWATAGETNNSGFSVERLGGDGDAAWETLAFVPGFGTTLEAQTYTYRVETLGLGTQRFRLKQIDYDGAFEYSPEIEVAAEMTEAFVLEAPYPNPARGAARVRFALRDAAPARLALYDALGREVAVLYDGTPSAGEPVTAVLDASAHASGTYFVRLMGERVSASQTVVLVD